MSKRAGELFATVASAKQKPVRCSAMIARRLNGKTADMYYHAVPAPVSNPDPSNHWSTKLQNVWNEHGFVEQLDFPAREVYSFGTYYQVLPLLTSRSIFRIS